MRPNHVWFAMYIHIQTYSFLKFSPYVTLANQYKPYP
jgi:hypothetical protein